MTEECASLFPSPGTVACARAIMEAENGWQADQHDPPSLRARWKRPDNLSVTLARLVLAEAEARDAA